MFPSLPPLPDENDLAEILDLFEEHVYAGAITADGRYIGHRSGPKLARFLGGPVPAGRAGGFWESRVHPDDQADYERFNQRLHLGEDAEITYRLIGLDGVTRLMWDRARPRRDPDGTVRVAGIISDVTSRNDSAARLAEASERFARLLDVVGEHVYVVLAFPDGRFEELFQGPGADRLLGGAEPDPEMVNWEAAVHPEDRAVYDAYNAALAVGEDADAEYRLVGADGITRWVHDRARCRRRPDGSVEASGIVSDVTERRRMRAELAQAHAALSQAVDAMDAHLYTLRVDPDGAHAAVYRGPNREALAGGSLPDGADGDGRFETLVHPEDRRRRAAALARLAAAEPIDLEYRVIGLDGRERIVADRLRAAARPRRDPLLRRGHARHHGAPSARGRAAAHAVGDAGRPSRARRGPRGGRAARADRRADRRVQPPPLHRDRRRRAPRRPARHGAAPARRRPLQARERRCTATSSATPCSSSSRRGCRATWSRPKTLRAGAARSSRCCCAACARTPRSPSAPSGCALAWPALRSSPPASACGLTISVGAIRAGGELADVDALVDAADRGLYAAKRGGRNRISLASHVGGSHAVQEPEAVSMARALAARRRRPRGRAEDHAGDVAALATSTAERLGLAGRRRPALPARRLAPRRREGGDPRSGSWRSRAPSTPPSGRSCAPTRSIGEEIVRGVAALREAAAAVRHHHERYGGDGYPDGLAGTAIPIEARIVAAADAYSAMTVDRVYSKARTPAGAAIELRRSAGAHLDPAVVEALLAVLGLGATEDARVA